MRIIGNIDHPRLKISVFRNDNRISIKFENALYEQTFKMKESITNTDDATRFVDDAFCENVEKVFIQMHQNKIEAMQRFLPPVDNDFFDEII
jgi:hypothetical protein